MAHHIPSPQRIAAHGSIAKVIEEFVGRVNTGTQEVSIARMRSPAGWSEPGQRPEFSEYTIVLSGSLQVELERQTIRVAAGEAILVNAGEWVRYSSPGEAGAEYIAVCIPAFSPETVHRDEGPPRD